MLYPPRRHDRLIILGKARQTSDFQLVRKLEPESDILAINDWYECYPNLVPYMLTNIHNKELFNLNTDIQKGKRWKNWIRKFNASGAYVWVNDNWEGLKNTYRVADNEWRIQFGNCFSSTICHALAIGYNMGYKEIRCHGFEGTPNEYRYEIPYILKMINKVRDRGISVCLSCEMERVMEARLKKFKVDWATVPDFCTDYKDLTPENIHLRFKTEPNCEVVKLTEPN